MRCTCLNCHRFKLEQSLVDAYGAKLERLIKGDLIGGVESRLEKGAVNESSFNETVKDERKKNSSNSRKNAPKRQVFTQLTLEAVQETLSEMISRMNVPKCQNCQTHCPAIKKQGAMKLFSVWGHRALVDNISKGVTITNVLDHSRKAEVKFEENEGPERKKARTSAVKEENNEDDDDLMNIEEEEDMDDLDAENAVAATTAAQLAQAHQKNGGMAAKKAAIKPSDLDLSSKYLTPSEVQEHLRLLWQREWRILGLIYSSEVGQGLILPENEAREAYRMFFLTVLPIAPNKFRPPSRVGEELFEHAQNLVLQKILNCCLELSTLQKLEGDGSATANDSDKQVNLLSDLGRRMNLWLNLQNNVCMLIDSTTAENAEGPGIRQTLEKKEGLFRKNMMGKRVNFAARSVISPDPYIGAGEIGVPPYFAKRLSFPERVTPYNVERLRAAVINGADAYPGAVAVQDERGNIIHLGTLRKELREALAKQLLSGGAGGARSRAAALQSLKDPNSLRGSSTAGSSNKIVYRHLQDGDLMLTNRQPTLHKPGLMAHRARVLKGERTIRMHYSNCATFNADFDGDEINLHLPQDHLGRAEGYFIVHADNQYIVPTDGKPIRGLIQDHVVSGMLLTKRGTFFTKEQYMQLVYVACTPWTSATSARARAAAGITGKVHATPAPRIDLDLPCMFKPRALWSGKQVLSTVIRYFTAGLPPLTFSAGGKVPASYWGQDSGEDELVFFNGYVVRGVVDKNVFGKHGLVHAVQELYGNTAAGQLLSAFSRLFTFYLQWHGFTCGMDDLLLISNSETRRASLLESAEPIAINASAQVASVDVTVSNAFENLNRVVAENGVADAESNSKSGSNGGKGKGKSGKGKDKEGEAEENPVTKATRDFRALMQKESAKVQAALGDKYRANRETGKMHDMKGSGVMHGLSSDVIKACLPSGQVKAFPGNCLSAMTISGAKGSLVNFSQISCLLGQQELEGRRPPRMASGKTLPCFSPYDGGARSNGFIGDRFLTGLRPQEYYFHCMAGREGLVDTAVKTSRSGYLQRCLVKNLEALRVHYDYTVRDNCDGSIVQLCYGEDGMDVMNISYLNQFGFLARNARRFAQQLNLDDAIRAGELSGQNTNEVDLLLKEREELMNKSKKYAIEGNDKKLSKAKAQLVKTLPVSAIYHPSVLGATSEAFADKLASYAAANPDGVLMSAADLKKLTKANSEKAGRASMTNAKIDTETFKKLMQLKFMRGMAAAGEAVGVLAAQSVGEPSTQMTLNTFHMAGRGEANVTLGIPRLREILMTAAAKIKTPVMTLPIHSNLNLKDAQVLANHMRKLRLAECLAGVTCTEHPVVKQAAGGEGFARLYEVTLAFYPPERYPAEAQLGFEELVACFRGSFSKLLKLEIEKEVRKKAGPSIGKVDVSSLAGEEGGKKGGDDEEDEGNVEGGGGSGKKGKVQEQDDDDDDEKEEEDEEEEENKEGKLRFAGGRGEAATYDGPDEEDEEAVKDARRKAQKRAGLDDDSSDEEEESVEKEKEGDDDSDEDDEDSEKEEEGEGEGKKGKKGLGKQKQTAEASKGRKRLASERNSKAATATTSASGTQVSSSDIDYQRFTCTSKILMPISAPKLLILEIVERVAALTMLRQTPGIDRVYVIEGQKGDAPKLQTDGVAFTSAWAHSDTIDVNGILTNDVYAVLTTYGVEAARATIMREVQSVFNAYGIGVDLRHLSLIADYMTHQGGYRAMNRMGIESSVSPFLKMSFETAAHFLTDATLHGSVDALKSPASRICVGRVVELGTGAVELVQQV
eukprot:CAMPEP_0175069470 /NCGR_PEP_ID=MMETSP0052_2-20121109/18211_1 /TAXON_ID=51329 ORGANISM="Polytomella parva, Strain SAG 63-3" /NCGR_SAMPLE_ID=MMETSP0052_2 /ASSEMBLY_ACC=CAM_ASM_000194 /LENGTH=1785 /DNA_ID=CAMNT_0016336545 /DNA_START=347 /DNA_END=5704 /DNA_ORIENTATION=-